MAITRSSRRSGQPSRSGTAEPDDDSSGNLMPFPYDWRRDNRVAAIRLAEVVKRKLALWGRREIENPRVLFVAHSMGGLVARYFLDVMGGWRVCRLITLGTPHRGAVGALDFLANGYQGRLNYLVNMNETMSSFTSIYQLLPAFKAVLEAGVYRYAHELTGSCRVNDGATGSLQFYKEMRDAVNAEPEDSRVRRAGIPPDSGRRDGAARTLQSATFDGKTIRTPCGSPATGPMSI